MHQAIKVGIIGDYNPDLRFHNATNEALEHAAKALSLAVDFKWLPTKSLVDQSEQKKLEQFFCNYGLNPVFRNEVNKGMLSITGVDPEGEVRIVEFSDHPFYVATLFLPQVGSKPGSPHPLILAYLKAAAAFQTRRN
jgi:CTP synthase (UTP-ammonia lyase)